MTRTIFEIIFLIEILYLAFHYYKLFKNVVKIRRETKISIGHNNKKLERAVRAHGNFCETSPLIIMLNFLVTTIKMVKVHGKSVLNPEG